MNTINQYVLGSDPEYAVVKDNKIVSGIGFVGGSKQEPLILNDELRITRTEDNVLAEFQFPPVSSKQEWLEMFRNIRILGNKLLSEYGMSLLAMSSHRYDSEELQSYAAQTFGCSPSINAWTEDIQFTCGPEEAGNLRSAGQMKAV